MWEYRRAVFVAATVGIIASLGLAAVLIYAVQPSAQTSGSNNEQSLTGSTSTVEAASPPGATTSSACSPLVSDNATNTFYTTDCRLGITLGVAASYQVSAGQNESVTLSLTNDLPTPRDVNYTGWSVLPHGPAPSSPAWTDDLYPVPPVCGFNATGTGYVPAYAVVYNRSNLPMQLTDANDAWVLCPDYPGPTSQAFNASQTITESFSLGGYWTSPNAGEPWADATFHRFGLGNYTVVAFDPWGQIVTAHFGVVPATTTADSSATSTSPGGNDTITPSSTLTTGCVIAGQPGPFFLSVVSDSDQAPVAGAEVTATNQPATISCDGSAPYPATNQTSLTFATNRTTEWYSLDPENNAGYSIVVAYAGNTYNFTADLRPDSTTCATLYLPSGRTNVTTGLQTACPSSSTTTMETTGLASSSSSPSSATAAAYGSSDLVVVTMPQGVGSNRSEDFSPSALTVVAGVNSTVEFVDQDALSGAPHDVHWTSEPAGVHVQDSPGTMVAGNTFTVTLTVPGTYAYECLFHSAWMKGTITVLPSA